jgi:hypothetical protein
MLDLLLFYPALPRPMRLKLRCWLLLLGWGWLFGAPAGHAAPPTFSAAPDSALVHLTAARVNSTREQPLSAGVGW